MKIGTSRMIICKVMAIVFVEVATLILIVKIRDWEKNVQKNEDIGYTGCGPMEDFCDKKKPSVKINLNMIPGAKSPVRVKKIKAVLV